MKYDFDQQIAKQVGVEEAILLSNISFWCAKNKADKSENHFHDGRYWTYSTEKAWEELFPFWTAKQISRIISNLEKAGLLLSKQYGGNNRTKWYSTSTQTVFCNNPNGSLQKTKRVVPIIETDNKPQIITTDNSSKEEKVPALSTEEYGSSEINAILKSLALSVGCTEFTETKKMQRFTASHIVKLYKSMAKEEFMERLKDILSDPFKRKNSNSIKYLYGQLKGWIKPTEGVRLKQEQKISTIIF